MSRKGIPRRQGSSCTSIDLATSFSGWLCRTPPIHSLHYTLHSVTLNLVILNISRVMFISCRHSPDYIHHRSPSLTCIFSLKFFKFQIQRLAPDRKGLNNKKLDFFQKNNEIYGDTVGELHFVESTADEGDTSSE